MKKILLLIGMAVGTIACDEGIGLQGDTIKFSTTNPTFDAKGGSFVITSEGQNWVMGPSIMVDEQLYGIAICNQGGEQINADVFIATCGVIHEYGKEIVKIEGSWFVVIKENTQRIIFDITPNDTGKERELLISISDGNYRSSITVTQSAE